MRIYISIYIVKALYCLFPFDEETPSLPITELGKPSASSSTRSISTRQSCEGEALSSPPLCAIFHPLTPSLLTVNRASAVLAYTLSHNLRDSLITDHRLAPIKKPFSKYPEFAQFKKIGLYYFLKLSKYLIKGLFSQERLCNKRILP